MGCRGRQRRPEERPQPGASRPWQPRLRQPRRLAGVRGRGHPQSQPWRGARVAEDMAAMRELNVEKLSEFVEQEFRVSDWSTCASSTVPTRCPHG